MSMRYVRLNLHLARLYALMCGTGMKRNATMFHYREECLNSSRLNEFSIVSINSAIQKPKEAT